MRLKSNSDDPLEEFPEWSTELRNAMTADVDPLVVAETAQLGAETAAAASLTVAAGTAAGGLTGGTTTMTTATMSAASAAKGTIASTLSGKLAAVILASAAVTGGLAVTGNLPGISEPEVPAATVTKTVPTIVDTVSGTVSLELAGETLSVVDIEPLAGWSATVVTDTASELTILFEGTEELVTVDAIVDEAGEIVTTVTSSTAVGVGGDAGVSGASELEVGVGTDTDLGGNATIGVSGDAAVDQGVQSEAGDVALEGGIAVDGSAGLVIN